MAMAIGDVTRVTAGDCVDTYCLDLGLYDTPRFGASYLIDADRPAVVDTGTGAEFGRLRRALDSLGIRPADLAVVALTHVHLDHAGGAGRLVREYPNATVNVHPLGATHLRDPDRLVAGTKRVMGALWAYHREPESISSSRVRPVEDGDTIQLGDHDLEVLAVPGHAPHQVAFYDRTSDALFPGDALGMWFPDPELFTVTTPPPSFDLEAWLTSHDAIRDVDPETVLYPHFGPRPAEGIVDEHEQRLSTWVDDIAAKREELDDETLIEHFVDASALRETYGEIVGGIPVRFSVEGVLDALDRED